MHKYLAPDRIDVLRNCMVRYTQPEAFNDLFEDKPYIAKITKKTCLYRQVFFGGGTGI
ncbi:hypothetical protein [Sporomusa sp. KB1]|uniref:hypothetical protein n=1 Tax=Sporomusa sp. KB1 TaxID=943346 RepID=UPI0016446A85|nr:hypothetical protein [Sporomusa sp. KB1]